MNFSISLLTLEKLLTSFLNLTLHYQPFLKNFHSGGHWGEECVPHCSCFHRERNFHSTSRREINDINTSVTLHSSFFPPGNGSNFLWLVRLGKGSFPKGVEGAAIIITPFRAAWSSEAADLWVRALTHLLGDGLSQGLQSAKDIQNFNRVREASTFSSVIAETMLLSLF